MSSDSNLEGCLGNILSLFTFLGTPLISWFIATKLSLSFWIVWPVTLVCMVPAWRLCIRGELSEVILRIFTYFEKMQSWLELMRAKLAKKILLRSTLSKAEAQALLIKAIADKDSEVVRLCIRYGADVNLPDNSVKNMTPLMLASRGTQIEEEYYRALDEAWCMKCAFIPSSADVLRILLDSGPSVDNVLQSYKLARIGGTNGDFGPWQISPEHIQNTAALAVLSEYIKLQRITGSDED